MRVRRRAVFGISEAEWRCAQELFVGLGIVHLALEHRPRSGFYAIDFEDEEALVVFLSRAEASGLPRPTVRRWHVYSERDIQQAELLVMQVGGPWRHRGLAVPWPGTAYDRSAACPACGAGIVPLPPLRLKRSDAPRAPRPAIRQIDFCTNLVAPALARRIRAARLSGVELQPVVPLKGGAPLSWWHLAIGLELPAWSPATSGVTRSANDLERACRICQRDGFFGTQEHPFEVVYGNGLRVADLPDMVRTREHFGAGALVEPFEQSRLSAPLLVVNQKVRALFKSEGVRTVRFSPVRIEG